MNESAILLSGGMDSYALAYMRRPAYAVTINYGQRPAEAEITAAQRLASRLGLQHQIVEADLSRLGSGDLSESSAIDAAPATDWWPYRNQALITLAAMAMIRENVSELLIATVKTDGTHKDGTEEFVKHIDQLLRMQEGGMKVSAPAIRMSTADLVRLSKIPYSLLAWAHSCHTGNLACGSCRGCIKSREVKVELGFNND